MIKHILLYLTTTLIAAFTVNVIAAPNAQLEASRLSGVAPLAVHFDAIGTTDTSVSDPFRELQYRFNFGDPTSGTWQYSGLSKNTQFGGPLAAHVYDNPGTYTVTLSVGNDTEQVSITVLNPNTVFSGTNTVCLSRNTDMTGCPSGAQRIPNINSWPAISDNKRYMLRAGQNFQTLGNLVTRQIHDVQITSFGSGAKPILADIFIQGIRTDYTGPWTSNVSITGLSPSQIAHGITGSNILVYENTLSGPKGIFVAHGFTTQRSMGTYRNTLTLPTNIFVVDNIDTISGGRHTGEGQTVWMGNLFGNTDEANMRLWQSYKSIVSHNKLLGNSIAPGKNNLKTHARGVDSINPGAIVTPTTRHRSSYIVIANNILNSPTSQNIWSTIGVKPQDRVLVEGIENVIMENNTHIRGAQETNAGAFAGRNIITRGEIFVGDLRPPAVNHQGESLPREWQGPYFIGTHFTVPQIKPLDIDPGTLSVITNLLLQE